MEKYKDLRQGDMLPLKVLLGIEPKSILRQIDFSDTKYCVLLSQDCDIVHKLIEEEPLLEFIVCSSIEESNGNLKNGKNPRKLQLVHNDLILEFFIHDKIYVEKQLCADLDLSQLTRLKNDNINILKKWAGQRYTRAAFPDEFNKRLSTSKKFLKIASKQISTQVSQVFFDVEDKELSSDQNYHLDVLIVSDSSEEVKTEIEEAYYEALNVGGVELNIQVLSEDEIPLSMIRRYKRWEKDSYSLNGEAAPLDEIDAI